MWFKRDLRVADHPALALAAAKGKVLPVWLAEPDYWRLPDTSARQWALTVEAVESLRAELAALGLPLVVRMGEAVTALDRLVRAHGITEMVSHEETGWRPGHGGWACAGPKCRNAGCSGGWPAAMAGSAGATRSWRAIW